MTPAVAAACTASAGLALMALEICGPRLLAPAFGSGTIVWSLVIGATMLALSLGGLLGGRLSEHDPQGRKAAGLLAAGALTAAVSACSAPLLAASIASRFPPTPTGQASALAFAAALLFVPAGLLTAAVFPLCLRACTSAVDQSGRTYASLYAASTLGSLAGVLLPPLILMSVAGTRASVALCCLPAMVSAAAAWRGRAMAAGALVAGALVLLGGIRPPSATHWESAYGAYEIVTQGDERMLAVDQALCYSSLRPGMTVTGHYHDVFLAAPWLAQRGAPQRIAVVGVAGGTLLHLFRRAWPQAQIDAVEIDPTLIDAARRAFDLDATGVSVDCLDGRCWLRRERGPYDLLAIDAMTTGTPPIHLMTSEFVEEAAASLSPSGVLVINTLPPLDAPVGAALRRVFAHTALIDSVAVGSRVALRAEGLEHAHPWSAWAARARAMLADLRQPPAVACLEDDAGALPWWWGLHVSP